MYFSYIVENTIKPKYVVFVIYVCLRESPLSPPPSPPDKSEGSMLLRYPLKVLQMRQFEMENILFCFNSWEPNQDFHHDQLKSHF